MLWNLNFTTFFSSINSTKVCGICRIFSYDLIIIYEGFFCIFPTTLFEYIVNVNLRVPYFTHWGCKVAIRRKTIKIPLTHLLIVSMNANLNVFLITVISCSVFKPTSLSRLARYSLRHDIMHKLSSVYELYSNLSRGLPRVQ